MGFVFIDFMTVADTGENPLNLPPDWPAESRGIVSEKEPETFKGNHRMTMGEYQKYLDGIRVAYDQRVKELAAEEEAAQVLAEKAAMLTAAKASLSAPETASDHVMAGLLGALVDRMNLISAKIGLDPIDLKTLQTEVGTKIDAAAVAVAADSISAATIESTSGP